MPKLGERLQNFFHCKRGNKTRNQEPADKDGQNGQEAPSEDESQAQGEPAKENPSVIMPPPLIEGEMPTYFHAGGLAKLSLIEGYENGVWRLQTTTRTKNDLFLSSFGEGFPYLTTAYGGAEALQQMGPYHASLCWLTIDEVLAGIGARGEAFGGKGMANLKLTVTTIRELQFKLKFKCGFERDPIKLELEVPIYREPLFMGYLMVVPAEHFLMGYRTVFDIAVKKFAMHAFCLGFNNQSTEVALKLENFEQLRGSIFQRLGEKWAVALKSDLYGNVEKRNFHVGCQYEWKPGTLIKAKVRGDGFLGFIFEHIFNEGIRVLINCFFNGRNPLNDELRLGAAWYFNV